MRVSPSTYLLIAVIVIAFNVGLMVWVTRSDEFRKKPEAEQLRIKRGFKLATATLPLWLLVGYFLM